MSELPNNYRILEAIKNTKQEVSEAFANNQDLEKDAGKLLNDMILTIEARLQVGAIRYGEHVPIEESDGRNMVAEAYEELCDAIVYLTSVALNAKHSNHYNSATYNSILFNIMYQTVRLLERIRSWQKSLKTT